MSFSPGWCYQPGLKGPGLYISNGSCIFYFSIYTSILAAATAIFDLASVTQPRPGIELVSPPPHPSPPSVAERFPPGLVVELVCRAAPSSSLAVSAVRRPRARCSARPRAWSASRPCPARAIRPSLLASCIHALGHIYVRLKC